MSMIHIYKFVIAEQGENANRYAVRGKEDREREKRYITRKRNNKRLPSILLQENVSTLSHKREQLVEILCI